MLKKKQKIFSSLGGDHPIRSYNFLKKNGFEILAPYLLDAEVIAQYPVTKITASRIPPWLKMAIVVIDKVESSRLL